MRKTFLLFCFLILPLFAGNIGGGGGDMKKEVYDTNNNNVIDRAEGLSENTVSETTIQDGVITSAKIVDGTITETDLSFNPAKVGDNISIFTNDAGYLTVETDPVWTADKTNYFNKTTDTTDNITEGITNKFYSTSLFNTDFASKTTDDLTEGTTNKYYSTTLFNNDFANKSINDLSDVNTTGWTSGKILKFDASGNLVVGDDLQGFDYKTAFSYYGSSNLASSGEYLSDEILVDTGVVSSISNIYLLTSDVDTDTSIVYYELYKGQGSPYDPNLEGYWKFEDTNWLDETNNNHDLTTSGSPTINSSGHSGNCVSLDGGSYLYVNDTSVLNPSSSWTLTAWIYITGSPTQNAMICGKYLSESDRWEIRIYNGKIQGDMINGGSGPSIAGTTSFSQNTWYFLCVRFDDTNNTFSVWVNGSQENSTSTTNTPPNLNTTYFTIGGRDFGDFFTGKLDDVSIWYKALSDTEIQDIYTNGISGGLNYNTKIADLTAGQGNSVSITNDTGRYKLKVIGSSALDFRGFTIYFK